jgi:hypothetical protein
MASGNRNHQGTMNNNTQRESGAERAQARRDAVALAFAGPLVTAVLLVIWAAAGAGYFWPLWPLLGMSIALIVALYRAYGPVSQPAGAGEAPRPPM